MVAPSARLGTRSTGQLCSNNDHESVQVHRDSVSAAWDYSRYKRLGPVWWNQIAASKMWSCLRPVWTALFIWCVKHDKLSLIERVLSKSNTDFVNKVIEHIESLQKQLNKHTKSQQRHHGCPYTAMSSMLDRFWSSATQPNARDRHQARCRRWRHCPKDTSEHFLRLQSLVERGILWCIWLEVNACLKTASSLRGRSSVSSMDRVIAGSYDRQQCLIIT